ncbi:MAG TPA: hypothetical protein VGG03_01860 [Thermoanaerobaculia bacterium]
MLVPVQTEDVHAKAVRRALRSKGHEAVLLYGSDYPTRQQASIFITQEAGLHWTLSDSALSLSDERFDAVWCRRPTAPVLPLSMHPGDREIAFRECSAFTKAFWALVAPNAFWVNPINARDRAASKPVQLFEAIKSGLTIPDTLCSNDPCEIRRFLCGCRGETIYKGFYPALWHRKDGASILYTSEIGPDDLPDDEVLRLAPGIFQKRIDKSYELRATFMGGYACSAKLLSQQHPEARIDWRSAGKEVEVVYEELPDEIYVACRTMMSRLGIVFGCFDFAVTPQGQHVFLEVNEMGQFLWLEELNPDLLLLESFCQFLIQGRLDRDWRPSGKIACFGEFSYDCSSEEEEEKLHVPTPDYFSVSDCEN